MSVTFATYCYEKDWPFILQHPEYLPVRQIQRNCYPFAERLLVINNVNSKSLADVHRAAVRHLDDATLTRIVFAEEIAADALAFFQLERADFASDAIYYNTLAPLAAIYSCKTDYLLFMSGDTSLEKPVEWIEEALCLMKKENLYKVANLTWNDKYKEAKREAEGMDGPFHVASRGFSDQMFLVRTEDFRQPIYREIHPESHHFPWGDIFEKRAFSAMLYRGWKRLTYSGGSYRHQNFPQ
jgi:hypothetical protein